LHLGQPRSEAKVLARSKSDVRRLCASDVKATWLRENRFVTIARTIPENHFVIGPNRLPGDLCGLDRSSAHVHYGADPAYDFGSSTRQQ
jgi:hypothetical protein